ncbi:P-loop containing nucleoside triphosphate hydrolase protein [Flagelloscypha sp. PMI_526]|nr:P-loop containing nucleoside triphosphate hydrolase protein [Flagelloscypha sp. PMI_526]
MRCMHGYFETIPRALMASPDCTLWEAGRATTAMPDLFSPISIGPEYIGELFISGELGWNNPTDMLTEEASRVFQDRHISCIVNVGSGHPGHLSLSSGLVDLFSHIAIDCERASERMERRFRKVPSLYMRLSVEQGMQNLDINLSNLHEAVSHTQSYLQGTRVISNVDNLLRDLLFRPERILVDMISGVVPSIAETLYPMVCPQPTAYFTGRQVELQTLQNHFTSPSESCRVGVLYGIGGGGKTQIGLQFIHLYRDIFSEIFFVDASDKLTLENSLKAIANESSDKPSVDDAMRLLRTRCENWLLFLDNAADPTLNLRPYVSWPHGNVLITTRNHDVCSHAPKCNIRVDKLEVEDATELLLRGVNVLRSSEIQELALKIVHELGYLALAINQTRAFLASGLCTLDEYLPIYMKNRKALMEDKPIQTTDDYEYTVYTTWTISFNRLSPDAMHLFELLCYMHHESIPCRLFEEAWRIFEREYGEAVPPNVVSFLSGFTTVDSTWDVLRFRKLIREILSFSLFEFNVINYSISLHPLVQQWAQHHSQDRHDIIPAAQTLLSLATPRGESGEDYAMRISLLPHLRESTKSGVQLHYSLLPRAGNVYRDGGMIRENFGICQRAFSETQQQLGSNDLDTLNCMGELALAYRALGENYSALKVAQEVLELRKQVQSKEHPKTLTAMDNLARVYSDLGRYQDALKLSEEVLELGRRVLGNEHPDNLKTMGNLAIVHRDLGQYQDALKMDEEVLEVRKRVLGNEHPNTLSTMGNLALVHWDLGQYQDALKMNEEVLELRKRVLGNEHPHTLMTMSNLALVYWDLGQYQDALKLNKEVVGLRK